VNEQLTKKNFVPYAKHESQKHCSGVYPPFNIFCRPCTTEQASRNRYPDAQSTPHGYVQWQRIGQGQWPDHLALVAVLDGKPYKQIRRSAVVYIQARLDTLDSRQILALYNEQKKTSLKTYDFDEEYVLNSVGYILLGKRRFDDAIAVFTYNTELFPQSGNAFDSLGEAYYNKGDKANALLNYKRSLELDPSNETAKMVIAELEKAAVNQ